MLPTTLLCVQKLTNLLSASNGLALAVSDLAEQNGLTIPAVATSNIVATSASADIADKNMQLSYPRVSVSSSGFRNTRHDKFCSLSGDVELSAEILSSASMVDDADRFAHFYVEAISNLLRANAGDWGDGVYFPGMYDVTFDSVRAGGFGFLQSARLSLSLTVSRT